MNYLIRSKKWLRVAGFVLLIVLNPVCVFAATPAGYSEYYIPGDEDDLIYFHDLIQPDTETETHTVISIVAWAANTTVYYDHWEDGYDFDFNDPDTADETVTLATRGTNHIFETARINTPRNPAEVAYDGRDHIYVAGGAVSLNRVTWPSDIGTVEAIGMEVYPVRPQLTTYILPFGENLVATMPDFERVFALVQATEDNTVVRFDLNGDGMLGDSFYDSRQPLPYPTVTSISLNAGECFMLDRRALIAPLTTLNSGVIIQGTETLQVHYLFCDQGTNYESRGVSAFPTGFWDDEYYAPVDGDARTLYSTSVTDAYVYNPHGFPITISYETLSGTGSFPVSPNTTVSLLNATGSSIPVNSALYLSGTDVFWGISGIDREDSAYDWSYSLIPATLYQDEQFIGWAPGCYPVGAAAGDDDPDGNSESDSGIFIAAAQDNIRVFVDRNADGTPDVTYNMDRLQSQYVWDDGDGDMSGTNVWATGPITMAYGQNPDATSPYLPSVDTGDAVIPGVDFVDLVLSVEKSTNPLMLSTTAGGTTVYTIVVRSSKYTVDNVAVVDTLAANWSFVNNSATITLADMTQVTGSAANPTISGGGLVLTWPTSLLLDMLENQEITISFTAQNNVGRTAGELTRNFVAATGYRTVGSPPVTQTFTASDFVFNTFGQPTIAKTSSTTAPLYPGDQYTYSVTLTNPAGAPVLTEISVYDSLPQGLTYVGPLTVSHSTVGDRFDTVAYDRDDGTNTWSSDWTETVEGTDPNAGYILIVNGELRLNNDATNEPTIYRNVAMGSPTSAILTFDYRSTGVVAADTIYVARRAGGVTTNIGTFNGIVSGTFSFVIPNNTDRIIFRFQNNEYDDSNDFFYVDNLSITYNISRTDSATIPPNLVNSLRGYALMANQNLTLSFPVKVDSPLSTGIDSITNSSCFTSDQFPAPICASATNIVLNPSSATAQVGDRVWFDVDGDGIDDAGEPGIANVEVTLKDQYGAVIAVTTTNGIGYYLFTGVEPDIGYYAEVTDGLPTGLTQSYPAGHSDDRTNSFDMFSSLGNNRDEFTGASYTNSNGTVSWTNSWVETDPIATAPIYSTGEIRITGGELRINADTGGTGNNIRRALNIPNGVNAATVTFSYRTTGVETSDSIVFEVSSDGTTFVPFYEYTNFTGAASGTATFDITDYLSSTTAIRFRINANYDAADDLFFVDNFNVAYSQYVQSYLNADLGYKAANSSLAVLGDRVWSDFDNDGVQDSGEPGIAGVTVSLYQDINSNGIYDSGTDTWLDDEITVPGGSYLFTGIAADGIKDYLVYVNPSQTALTGYTATTSNPRSVVDLPATDVQLYHDFGFRNASGTYTIKDRVWVDANTNTEDDGENGISGVTVDLLDASLNVIASTTTDINGYFIFSGVPGGGADYTIKITDVDGKLNDYYGTTTPGIARELAVNNVTANVDPTAEPAEPNFGYYLSRALGDTVFNDNGAGGGTANNGTRDGSEPGISGVTVLLYRDVDSDGLFEPGAADGNSIATLITDANGNYLFTGLANATYFVSIDNTQAALSGFSLTSTDDEAAAGNQQQEAIAGGVSNLNADFGYYAAANRSVSGTVWVDPNNNGVIDAGEVGISNVTLELQRTMNNRDQFGTAAYNNTDGTAAWTNAWVETDAGGGGATGGNIMITGGELRITGAGGLNSIRRTLNPPSGSTTANLSFNYRTTGVEAPDSIMVEVSGDGVNFTTLGTYTGYTGVVSGTANFDISAYLSSTTAIRFRINAGYTETGASADYFYVDNVDINYGVGSPIGAATTNTSGYYEFTGMPAGTYQVLVTDENGALTDYYGVYENTEMTTSPFNRLEAADATSGNVTGRNFGYYKPTPTYASIASFRAYLSGGSAVIEWETSSESGTAGFDLMRADDAGEYIQVNERMIPAVLRPQGGVYCCIDRDVKPGGDFTYMLIEIDSSGSRREYGPYTVSISAISQASGEPLPTAFFKVGYYRHAHELKSLPTAAGEISSQIPASISPASVKSVAQPANGANPALPVKIYLKDSGLYQISAESLAGVFGVTTEQAQAWIAAGAIQMTNSGEPVSYRPSDLNSGVDFYGEPYSTIYTDYNVYWLSIGSGQGKGDINGDGQVDPADAAICLDVLTGTFNANIRSDYAASGADVNGNAKIEMAELAYISDVLRGGGVSGAAIMETVSGHNPAPVGVNSFEKVQHYEEDVFDTTNLFEDPESDYWFWGYVIAGDPYNGFAEFPIQADSVALNGFTATLKVNLNGALDMPGGPDNHVRILLNGTALGEMQWDGTNPASGEFIFNPQLLNQDGNNVIRIEGLTGAGIVVIDSFDLTYHQLYRAVGDVLAFDSNGFDTITVSGFTGADIDLFELSDPKHPKVVIDTTIDQTEDGYRISFQPDSGQTQYLAVLKTAVKAPEAMGMGTQPGLKDLSNQADYLIITSDTLAEDAQGLADYRQSRGLIPKIVTITEIFDEFNYGLYNPHAIRDFIAYAAANWSTRPKYVALVGDGTYDYKNHFLAGDNFVPVLMTGTPYGLFPADSLYVDLNSDGAPDLPIGRIPVDNAGQMAQAVNKIVNYEAGMASNKHILMAADNPDAGGDFPTDSDAVAALVPADYTVEKIYLPGMTKPQANQQLINGINAGSYMFNYIGHGGYDILSNYPGILKIGDEASFTNTQQYPVFVALTCLVGGFSIPGFDSLSEVMTLQDGKGFIAAWSPSGLSINSEAVKMNKNLFTAVFTESSPDLGSATLRALQLYQAGDHFPFMINIYNILGDPALKLH